MSGRNANTLMRVVTLATAMTGAIGTSETASAQEAIMLEIIGAVRMAAPEKARQVAAEPDEALPLPQEKPPREVRRASAH